MFRSVLVYLVDKDYWDTLIIGHPALSKAKLSPEDHIQSKGVKLQ